MLFLAQLAAAQKADGDKPPAESVEDLIELTIESHPFLSQPLPVPPKQVNEAGRQKQEKLLDDALAVNKDLTPEQKLFVKANYKKLREIVVGEISDTFSEVFAIKEWTHEFLGQRFSQKLTGQEITELIAYFHESGGQTVLKILKNAPQSKELIKNGGKSLNTKAEEAEFGKFAATTTGKNFIDAYLSEYQEYLDAKFAEAGQSGKSKVEAIVDPANVNKIINQFVKDNYQQ